MTMPTTQDRSSSSSSNDRERITAAEIFQLLEERRGFYAQLHAEQELDEDYLHWTSVTSGPSAAVNRLSEGFPKGYVPKVLPLAKVGVDNGVNTVAPGEVPSVNVTLPPGLHTSLAEQEAHAEEIEQWLSAWIRHVDTAGTESPIRDFLVKEIALGQAVFSFPLVAERIPKPPESKLRRTHKQNQAWRDYERELMMTFPWDVRSLHPRSVFADPDADPSGDFIVEEMVSTRSMLKAYPRYRELRGATMASEAAQAATGNTQRTSRKVTYVSANDYAVFVDRVPVLGPDDGANDDGIAPNPCGGLWMLQAAGGFGDSHLDGRPEYLFKGIIRDIRDAIVVYLIDFNAMSVMRRVAAFAPMHITGPEDLAQKAAAEFVWGVNTVVVTDAQVGIAPVKQPEVNPIVFQERQEAAHLLEIWLGPDVMRGVHESEPATLGAQRLSQSKMPFRPAKKNAEQALALMLMGVLRQVKELGVAITVWSDFGGQRSAHTLQPDRIPEGLYVTVDCAPPTEQEKAQRQAEGYDLYDKGGISRRRLMADYLGIDDPSSEMALRAAEDLLREVSVLELGTRLLVSRIQRAVAQQFPEDAQAIGPEQTMPQAGGGGAPPAGPEPPMPQPDQPPDQPQQPEPVIPAPGGRVLPGQQPPPGPAGQQEQPGPFPLARPPLVSPQRIG